AMPAIDRDGRGQHHALHIVSGCRFGDVQRATGIDVENTRDILDQSRARDRTAMDNAVRRRAAHQFIDGSAITQITGHRDSDALGIGAYDIVARIEKSGSRGAEESGRAGDEDFHPRRWCAYQWRAISSPV